MVPDSPRRTTALQSTFGRALCQIQTCRRDGAAGEGAIAVNRATSHIRLRIKIEAEVRPATGHRLHTIICTSLGKMALSTLETKDVGHRSDPGRPSPRIDLIGGAGCCFREPESISEGQQQREYQGKCFATHRRLAIGYCTFPNHQV
jgi:hypothetical protein